MKNHQRAQIMVELRQLEHRRSELLEELEETRLRDSIAMSIIQGRAANPDPDAGVTFNEVLLAYVTADDAIAKASTLGAKIFAPRVDTSTPIDLHSED